MSSDAEITEILAEAEASDLTVKTKRQPRVCQVKNCPRRRYLPSGSKRYFYRFPYNDRKRCWTWIRNVGNREVADAGPDGCKRNRHWVVCSEHFDYRSFVDRGSVVVLVDDAVPTQKLRLTKADHEAALAAIPPRPKPNRTNATKKDGPKRPFSPIVPPEMGPGTDLETYQKVLETYDNMNRQRERSYMAKWGKWYEQQEREGKGSREQVDAALRLNGAVSNAVTRGRRRPRYGTSPFASRREGAPIEVAAAGDDDVEEEEDDEDGDQLPDIEPARKKVKRVPASAFEGVALSKPPRARLPTSGVPTEEEAAEAAAAIAEAAASTSQPSRPSSSSSTPAQYQNRKEAALRKVVSSVHELIGVMSGGRLSADKTEPVCLEVKSHSVAAKFEIDVEMTTKGQLRAKMLVSKL